MARCAWCGTDNAPDGSFCLKCGKPLPWGLVSGACEKCGADNALGMTRCGSCGAPLSAPRQAPQPQAAAPSGPVCKWCGKQVPPGSDMCWECAEGPGEDYIPEVEGGGRSETLNAAGAMLIIAGVIMLIQGVLFVANVPVLGLGVGYLVCCGFLEVLFGVGAIMAGLSATKRENFALVVVGCVLAIVGFGAVIGTLLGVIALLIVLADRGEFD
ncbi:MAG: zinc ribbon domain-containing protein [Candidatus Thermoplasmatota archaeon]